MSNPAGNSLHGLVSSVNGVGLWTLSGLCLLAVIVLSNIKGLPFAWHVRVWYALFTHRKPPLEKNRPGVLFLPVLTHTSTPAVDCDYNLHKSNSTYFADLDVARVHLLGALGLANVLDKAPRPALGGAACNFRRPIAPYQSISIYTRVLNWDGKWLYLASWMVPRTTHSPAKASSPSTTSKAQEPFVPDTSGVYATSVARYVFKQGRRTVPPETVLRDAGLLPASSSDGEPTTGGRRVTSSKQDGAHEKTTGVWGWHEVEQERQRGQAVVSFMSSLETLQGSLGGGRLLGEF